MSVRRKKLEKVEEDKFVKLVESYGWQCYKLSMAGPFGKAGFNDRVVFASHGVTALFEFKREDEEARPLQIYRHRILKKLKHKAYVVYRSDEAFKILKGLINDRAKIRKIDSDKSHT
jgi:hypothetical protein